MTQPSKAIRSPVCTCLGHVDHGKSSILDAIRGTAITATEVGGITQAIGASIIPLATIKKRCGGLLETLKMDFTIPGLLFIDTPGHAAFTNLRKRGGNLADIAVLVVDMNEGFKPQTLEALDILKFYKTPFVVAANKLDLTPGWQKKEGSIIARIGSQNPQVTTHVETKLYEIVGKLSEGGFNSERFDRVNDFTKEIAIIPVSAKTQEGIPELLMVIVGLAQKFLESSLNINVKGEAKGTILEVKEEKGLGTTLDVIIYDGTLKTNDIIVIGGIEKPHTTKVRALLTPAPLAEIRDKKSHFSKVPSVVAASAVRISAPNVEGVIAGMPIHSASQATLMCVEAEVQKEVEEVLIETDKEGILVKADTIGSLEALCTILRQHGIKIRRASVGDLTKKDVTDAQSNAVTSPLTAVILGFNMKVSEELRNVTSQVKIFHSDIIYALIDQFEAWLAAETKRLEAQKIEGLVRPCKMRIMLNYVFRQSNPAVVGMDILVGRITVGTKVIKDGKEITSIKSIQHEKESVSSVSAGKQVAIALPNVTVGRQIHENDILYSAIPEPDFRKLKDNKQFLSTDEIEVLKEIAQMKRKENPVWGV